jgi:hypothetical protein
VVRAISVRLDAKNRGRRLNGSGSDQEERVEQITTTAEIWRANQFVDLDVGNEDLQAICLNEPSEPECQFLILGEDIGDHRIEHHSNGSVVHAPEDRLATVSALDLGLQRPERPKRADAFWCLAGIRSSGAFSNACPYKSRSCNICSVSSKPTPIALLGDDPINTALLDLRNELVERRNRLADRYEDMPRSDPRREVARHLKAVVSATYLERIFHREHLGQEAWWRAVGLDSIVGHESVQDELDDFGVHIAQGFVMTPFFLFEAGCRRVARTALPSWYSDRRSFGGTANQLVGFANLESTDTTALLELYRLVRNTVHNNARYFSAEGNVSAHWRGRRFDFTVGAPQPFVGWELYIELVRALGELTEAFMTAAPVAALPAMPLDH